LRNVYAVNEKSKTLHFVCVVLKQESNRWSSAFIENKKYTQAIYLNYINIHIYSQFTNKLINNLIPVINLILGF